MHVERFDPVAEPGKARACYQMYTAGLPVDDPDGPPLVEPMFSAWLKNGWAGERRETALAASEPGGAWVGAYLLELPHRSNEHQGRLTIMVPPGERRHGHGTGLLRHAARRAAVHGRTLLSGDARCGSPGSAFAAAVGARAGVIEVRRVLDLADIQPARLAGLRRSAEEAAQGYSLLCWAGATPADLVLGVATVSAAMADAPHNPGDKPSGVDIQRVKDHDRRNAELGFRRYSVAARCDRTGEMVALTELGVDQWDPSWGFQLVTAVTREHRGHRLGLLVKLAMLDMFTGAEPAVRRILTGNADGNQHMIAINAELGFRVLDEWQSWELDVAAVG